MEDVKITKRNGEKEIFAFEKIQKVVMAAGLTSDKAALVAKNIASWIKGENKKELTSLEIRDRVIKELEELEHRGVIKQTYKSGVSGIFYESTEKKK